MLTALDSCATDVITDMSTREGSQIFGQLRGLSVDQKLEVVRRSIATGIKTIELTAFSQSEWYSDSHELTSEAISKFEHKANFRALYFNTDGLEEHCKYPSLVKEGLFHTALTEKYRRDNYRQTDNSSVIKRMGHLLEKFKEYDLPFTMITLSTAFGDRGEHVTPDDAIRFLAPLFEHAKKNGKEIESISIADTVGEASPTDIKIIIDRIKKEWPQLCTKIHLHPIKQQADDCIHAALDAGVHQFEATWSGLGGSPYSDHAGGNLDIASIVEIYRERKLEHGFNLDAIKDLQDYLKQICSSIK